MSKNKTPIRSIALPDGQKAEICCGQEATKILRACPDFFRRLLEQQVEATYEVPHLPFWWVRLGLRNLFGPLVEQIGRLFDSFDRRIGRAKYFINGCSECLKLAWARGQIQYRCY